MLKCVKWPQEGLFETIKNVIRRKCDLRKLRPFKNIYFVLSRFVSQGVINEEMFAKEKALITLRYIVTSLDLLFGCKKKKKRIGREIGTFVFL